MSLDTYRARKMSSDQVLAFYSILREANPHPQTELNYSNTFELLVAVLLSAQSTDVGVNKVTPRLFTDGPTPAAMAKLGLEGLKDRIKTLGLYQSKAKHLLETCQILDEKFGGQVPRNREELEALPGVGRKTANVVLNTAFGEPVMAVDTHIFRVSNRTGLAPGKTVRAVEEALIKRTPGEFLLGAHHWLILHGRYCCKARSPECGKCPVFEHCNFKDKVKIASASVP